MALARGLPPDVFYSGDSGVKLVASRHAIAGPSRPFEIPLPDIGGAPAPFVDPFFVVHDTHSHAVTPEIFPLLTAPFLAAFGLRGVYVLPAAGLLLVLASTAWLALLLDRRRGPVAVLLTTFLGTPLLFYGLEFWEHAVAAGIAVLATALFVRAADVSAGPSRFFGAGLLFGLAVLLRPEAVWFGAAVLGASPLLRSRPSRRQVVIVAAGILSALAPFALYALWHFGQPLPPHIGNAAHQQGDWLAIRRSLFLSWFVSAGKNSFWRVAPAILLALVWRPTSYFGGSARRGRPFLLVVAVATAALVILSAPNDGGAQWGPRYMLLVYPPLAILATDTLAYVVRFLGMPRRAARDGARSPARGGAQRAFAAMAIAAVGILALGSAWLQRSAYKELRGGKMTYSRIVSFVERETAPGRAVVTDVWSLDQVAAALADSRRFFVVDDAAEATEVLHRLSESREPVITLLRNPVDSPGPFSAWLGRSCYAFDSEHGDGEGLIAVQLVRACNK